MNKQKCLKVAVSMSALFGILGLTFFFWSRVSIKESESYIAHVHDNLNPNLNNDTLIFASVLFVHQKHPIVSNYYDQFNDRDMEMFETGQFLRRRYNHLLNGLGYSYDRIQIVTSDVEHVITGAQAAIAGLFPPNEEKKWHNDISWQPIPIHTMTNGYDNLFTASMPCPKYETLFDYYMKESPEAQEVFMKYKDQISYWEEISGINFTNIDLMACYYKTALEQKNVGRLDESLADLKDIYQTVFKLKGTPELLSLREGFLLQKILDNANERIESISNRVLYLYSGHSENLSSIIYALGYNEVIDPPNASSLLFEVYRNANNEHYFQLFFRKPREEFPVPFNVMGCGTKWTLQQFYSEHGNIIPGDFNTECKI